MIETARLPPIYHFVAAEPGQDPEARARALAQDGADPATIVCADRADRLDCSVVLEPGMTLAEARLVVYVGMLGLGDALGTVVPPGIDVSYRWPNVIEANIAPVARIDLYAPGGDSGSEMPPWMTLRAVVALTSAIDGNPDAPAFETTIADEGGPEVDVVELLESFGRHFLSWMSRWEEDGFDPVRAMWLYHAPSHGEKIEIAMAGGLSSGLFRDIGNDGAMILEDAEATRAIPLASMLNP
ncbi:MAG: biotin/lipoate--protein ligase family protein [Alphaproteobacteria bacterium]